VDQKVLSRETSVITGFIHIGDASKNHDTMILVSNWHMKKQCTTYIVTTLYNHVVLHLDLASLHAYIYIMLHTVLSFSSFIERYTEYSTVLTLLCMYIAEE